MVPVRSHRFPGFWREPHGRSMVVLYKSHCCELQHKIRPPAQEHDRWHSPSIRWHAFCMDNKLHTWDGSIPFGQKECRYYRESSSNKTTTIRESKKRLETTHKTKPDNHDPPPTVERCLRSPRTNDADIRWPGPSIKIGTNAVNTQSSAELQLAAFGETLESSVTFRGSASPLHLFVLEVLWRRDLSLAPPVVVAKNMRASSSFDAARQRDQFPHLPVCLPAFLLQFALAKISDHVRSYVYRLAKQRAQQIYGIAHFPIQLRRVLRIAIVHKHPPLSASCVRVIRFYSCTMEQQLYFCCCTGTGTHSSSTDRWRQ